MPKHKRLTITAEFVTAGRKRKCYHNQAHSIKKGDRCLEVTDGMALKGYCLVCAAAMIDASISELETLRSSLVI
jgi:hypothetical protein